jgi:hypothetical protein
MSLALHEQASRLPRSEVFSSAKRYAAPEISYILQGAK